MHCGCPVHSSSPSSLSCKSFFEFEKGVASECGSRVNLHQQEQNNDIPFGFRDILCYVPLRMLVVEETQVVAEPNYCGTAEGGDVEGVTGEVGAEGKKGMEGVGRDGG